MPAFWLLLSGCGVIEGPHPTVPLAAAQAAHPIPATAVERIAARMREYGEGEFTVRVEGPYVVAGDERAAVVDRRVEQTVRWAHRQLRTWFFDQDPAETVPVWLFRDATSYRRHVEALTGRSPTTPFGFADRDGLFMNISTGGGTLIHEMVHPLMMANFPEAPPWYNEGLASLFETVRERDGRIQGMLNWRLRDLERALATGGILPVDDLLALDSRSFYASDRSWVHYAQARYLLYQLQEDGRLIEFHRAFMAGADADPTGARTLRRALGTDDLAAWQAGWERAATTWEWSGR